MERPKGCIYPNCLNCPLPECNYDGTEIEDDMFSSSIDREIIHMRLVEQHYINGTYSTYASRRRYYRSKKGKEALKKYFSSDKGKEAIKRYFKTDKGREAQKRKSQKDIKSGKNAERCRRYYERHKAEILAKKKAERMCI